MNGRKLIVHLYSVTAVLLLCCTGCGLKGDEPRKEKAVKAGLASDIEQVMNSTIIEAWYPRCIDTLKGGYITRFNADWTRPEQEDDKVLVHQARHLWTTSLLSEFYPGRKEFPGYAAHGFKFIKEKLLDKEEGGFYYSCTPWGDPAGTIDDKRIYGQSFALYAISRYYMASSDPEALELARELFLWMEKGPHDPVYGGYFEYLHRNGSPAGYTEIDETSRKTVPTIGLKDYNSSIHMLESLTELYRIWPDTLVRKRLEEMFYLIRDTFVHPDGYLRLYFYADWTPVPDSVMDRISNGQYLYTNHISYGHDVETAYLLLESEEVLGYADEKTRSVAKKLVDHSLASGWDRERGGFFEAGILDNGGVEIIDHNKSWWSQAEGLNSLLLMDVLFPGNTSPDYWKLFVDQWNYIREFIIDSENGGWYNYGLDTYPGNRSQAKSHAWKSTYHTTRALVNCIINLRNAGGKSPNHKG